MRQYLDIENQFINPTLKKINNINKSQSVGRVSHMAGIGQEGIKENPATTMKFVAYVAKRRKDMEEKKFGEELKF